MTTASLPILFIHSAKTLRVLYGLLRQTDYVNMMGGASQSMKWNLEKGGIIRHVFEDKRHRLWVITHKGVNLYNRNKDNFNFVSVDSLNNFSRVIYQDDKGKIYMGGSGAFIYNEQTSKFDPFYVNQDETITAFITAITSDQKGQMWFGRMYGGLICADVENGKLTRYKHNDHNINSLISNKVTSLFTDHHGRIWIGTEDKGICYFDSSTNKFIRIEGFPQICVRTFAEDAEGCNDGVRFLAGRLLGDE